MTVPAPFRSPVVVVGGGFAGFLAAGTLERLLTAEPDDLTTTSAADHPCDRPLLPEVAAGRQPRTSRRGRPPVAPRGRPGLRRTAVGTESDPVPGGHGGHSDRHPGGGTRS